ncbi:hypothetical protein STEG23_020167, partial [Scotinomys teguina]
NSFSASADNSLGLFKSLSPSRVLAKFCSRSLDIPMIPRLKMIYDHNDKELISSANAFKSTSNFLFYEV